MIIGLNLFPIAANGWYDTRDQYIITVPESGILLLMVSGLIGVFGVSRRRA